MKETARKIKKNLLIIIVLCICLSLMTCTASFAAGTKDTYKINLNGGLPIIEEEGINLAPGDTISKEFWIENMGDTTAKYRLYFNDVKGSLKDKIEVTIYDKDEIILHGILNALATIPKETTGILLPREKKTLKIDFYFPQSGNNGLKKRDVTFDLNALAEWSKN